MTNTKPGVPIRLFPSEAELTRRASAAYYRSADNITDQPTNKSGLRTHNGRVYVVLEGHTGILAVYRFHNYGQLRAMRRWPKEIEAGRATR